MPRILLITNPAHDRATEYLDAWSQKLLDVAKQQKDVVVFELRGKETTREKVSKLIEGEKPQLIIFNGHGDKNSITGYDFEVLIRCDDNESLLSKKIVHAFACDSGKTLGPKCVAIGGTVYIGYREKFKLTHLNKSTSVEQAKDPIAAFFLEPAFSAVLALIEGKDASEACGISQNLYVKNLQFLITHTNADFNTVIASRLYHNFSHQVCLGTPSARF